MALKYGDRVQETTATTGTGTYSLGGAATGYQAFSGVLSNADTCYYAITDGTNWEVGLGTYTSSGSTLARTTILASSNGGSAVSWAAGSKNIWLDLPASAIQSFLTTALPLTTAQNTLGGDVTMTNASQFYDGPSMAQGASGKWFVTGGVNVVNSSNTQFTVKLWDGTTVFDSKIYGFNTTAGSGSDSYCPVSAICASPAANLKISVSSNNTGSTIKANASGAAKDSQIFGLLIG